jgi:Sulfotransferase domain
MDERVWITKSHFPGYFPWELEIERGEKVIIVVRNPLDSIVSLLHQNITLTMGKSIENDLNTDFPEFWNECVDKFSLKFEAYYKYWIDLAKTKEFPIIFVRYEDLLLKKREVLVEIFKFLLDVSSLEGLYVMDRIEAEIQKGS